MRDLLLNRVEHIVAKVEIARFEQFLLLPQCFQKSTVGDASKCVYTLERVKVLNTMWHLVKKEKIDKCEHIHTFSTI